MHGMNCPCTNNTGTIDTIHQHIHIHVLAAPIDLILINNVTVFTPRVTWSQTLTTTLPTRHFTDINDSNMLYYAVNGTSLCMFTVTRSISVPIRCVVITIRTPNGEGRMICYSITCLHRYL